MEELAAILDAAAPLLETTLRDALLAAWLESARDVTDRMPPPRWERPPAQERLLLPPTPEPRVVEFPQIDAAAQSLAERQALTRDQYDLLAADARQQAFTVAHVARLDALEKIRDLLVVNIGQGGTLRDFQADVLEALDDSALAPGHVETVYRTNILQAYSTGQRETLRQPLVAEEFPYLAYFATHDSRTRKTHLELETLGLDGTNVYRRDDPVMEKFWPPWDFNCRCKVVPLTIADAASRGVSEARRWLDTGEPPDRPAHVPPPPFSPPPGWDRGTS